MIPPHNSEQSNKIPLFSLSGMFSVTDFQCAEKKKNDHRLLGWDERCWVSSEWMKLSEVMKYQEIYWAFVWPFHLQPQLRPHSGVKKKLVLVTLQISLCLAMPLSVMYEANEHFIFSLMRIRLGSLFLAPLLLLMAGTSASRLCCSSSNFLFISLSLFLRREDNFRRRKRTALDL